MRPRKIYYLAALPFVIAGLFWLITEAFHMLTAKSDLSVLGGVLLLCFSLFVIIWVILFIREKLL